MKRNFPALSLPHKGICSLVTQFCHIAQHTVPYILLQGMARHDNGLVCSKLLFCAVVWCNRERERVCVMCVWCVC